MNKILSPQFTVACLGDLMIGGRAAEVLRKIGANAMSKLVWWPLTEADLILANLEVPITESAIIRENKRYNFKTTYEILELFDRRFALCIANNHILDYGEQGLLDTIEILNKFGIPHAGAGRNLAEASRPIIMNIKGINIGVVCAADRRYQSATDSSPGTFPDYPIFLKNSIREIRQQLDLIVVSIHSGMEFVSAPSPHQIKLAEVCLREGAHLVSFHHAHRLSGFLKEEEKLILFGTGNYIFPPSRRKEFSFLREGAAWKIIFGLPDLQITQIDIQPVFLNQDGLPTKATKTRSKRILKRINRYSRRIHQRKYLSFWRFWEMIQPSYLRLNLSNYANIYRRRGTSFLLKTIYSGFKTHTRWFR